MHYTNNSLYYFFSLRLKCMTTLNIFCYQLSNTKAKKGKSLFGFLSIGRYENHIVIGKYKILKNYDRHIATTDLTSEKKI